MDNRNAAPPGGELNLKLEGGVEKTPEDLLREQRIRQLAQVVCICKGINLGRILKGLAGSESVADVNRKVGSGTGGCCGERCSPKIKALLDKQKKAKEKS